MFVLDKYVSNTFLSWGSFPQYKSLFSRVELGPCSLRLSCSQAQAMILLCQSETPAPDIGCKVNNRRTNGVWINFGQMQCQSFCCLFPRITHGGHRVWAAGGALWPEHDGILVFLLHRLWFYLSAYLRYPNIFESFPFLTTLSKTDSVACNKEANCLFSGTILDLSYNLTIILMLNFIF